MLARRFFLIILALYLVLATAYSVAQPLGEAPDEADHYAYARYLAQNRALPVGPAVTQSKHPPLYHAAVAALAGWTGMDFDFLRANPDAFPLGTDAPPNFFIHTTLESWPWRDGALALHLARLFSVALGAVTLWATWRLGRECFPKRPEIGLIAAAFLMGLPGFLYISGAMNNDNAAGAFGALVLLFMARIIWRGIGWARLVGLGIVLGLGLLSKVGTLALWPLVAIAIAGAMWPQRHDVRAWLQGLGYALFVWLLGLLIASPWLLRNWQLYNSPLAWELVRQTVDERLASLTAADLVWLAKGLYSYFWGRFGPVGQVWLPGWAYVLAGVFVLAAVIGIVYALRRWTMDDGTVNSKQLTVSGKQSPLTTDHRPLFFLLLLALAPLLVLASIVQYSTVALGTDQARLMWPAIAAIAVWVGVGVAGFAEWVGRGRIGWARLTAGFIALAGLAGLLALLLALRPAFAPPAPAFPPGTVAAEQRATFGDSLNLISVELPPAPLKQGESIPITLLWQASQPLAADLRPVVRLVHQDGWLAAEWDHSPAQGRYATDRWQPGEIIADPYLLEPDPASSGEFTVLLGVRPFRGDWLPISPSADGDFLTIGRIQYE
ncbi:MAG: glycosyltransferase family 39 protein [Caldilineales bacterium]|nr:glycosyltransferase family 39 protein [Caldilineales bacterium]